MQLKMVEGQYIFKDNLPLYRVTGEGYADEIFTEISRILAGQSPEVALAVLEKLPTLLEGKIRKCNDYDLMQFSSQHSDERKKQLGEKHTCESCNRKFYDLHKNYQCPLCKTPISVKKTSPATLISM